MKVFEQINDGLELIKNHYKVKILYACESGTRAWGVNSPDNDYNIRFIYIHTPDWYLSIRDQKDSIELFVDKQFGIVGWDIRKALRSFGKSNVAVFSWLRSPIVYESQDNFADILQDLENEYFSPKVATKHYLGLVQRTWERYANKPKITLKTYLSGLRALLSAIWITKYQTAPPMKFAKLLVLLEDYLPIQKEIKHLLELSSANGANYIIDAIPLLDKFVKTGMKICDEATTRLEKIRPDITQLNDLFREFVVK